MSFVPMEEEVVSNVTKHVKSFELPGGYIATPIFLITRKDPYSETDRSITNHLDFTWKSSLLERTPTPHPQRCPSVWADNFVFFMQKGMKEPELLLGEWSKRVKEYGEEKQLHGLVVAAGGHYERQANKKEYPQTEKGHLSWREAADRELFEEVKIPKERVKATQMVAVMDDVYNDPRVHGIRGIHLRWVEMEPKSSDELKTIVSVPLSCLPSLCGGKVAWSNSQGKKLGFILNHEKMVSLIMHLPDTQTFLVKILESLNENNQPTGVFPRTFA